MIDIRDIKNTNINIFDTNIGDCKWKVLVYSYLIFVILFTVADFKAWKFYTFKVHKFATKIVSQQNSKNHSRAKIHSV